MFQLYQDQVQILLDAFKNPPQTREEGIYFDDRQYRCVRADKTSIYGKCVSYLKNPRSSDTPNICCNHPKFEQGGLSLEQGTYQCFPPEGPGRGLDYTRELDNFEKLGSNSLPM